MANSLAPYRVVVNDESDFKDCVPSSWTLTNEQWAWLQQLMVDGDAC